MAPKNQDLKPQSAPTVPIGPLSDAEYEQAIQQQQSIYSRANNNSTNNTSSTNFQKLDNTPTNNNTNSNDKKITVKRSGGGKTWEDPSLLEWDPTHFRLFVGNLSPEVTDEMLHNTFMRFSSMSKVKAIMDHKTGKNKGYGFVSFKDPEDYFKAFKQVNGKYIGNHPVQLKKANTDIKRTATNNNKKRHHPYKRR